MSLVRFLVVYERYSTSFEKLKVEDVVRGFVFPLKYAFSLDNGFSSPKFACSGDESWGEEFLI